MKKLFATMSMMAALATVPAFAGSDAPLKIRIPYDFVVSGKTLPAGEYRIAESFSSSIVYVRGANAATSAMVLGNAGATVNEGDSSLAFAVVNGTHYLVNVTHNGVAKDLPRPHSNGPVTLAFIKAVTR